MPEAIARLPLELFRTQEIDAKATGTHELMTTDPTPFMPFFVVIYVRNAAGVTGVPSISIGTNDDANNVLPITSLAALDTTGEYARLPIGTVLANGVFRGMAPQSSVTLKIKVTTAAQATTYWLETQIVGAYI